MCLWATKRIALPARSDRRWRDTFFDSAAAPYLTTERFDQMLGRIMHPVETYRGRAERAERNFENARDRQPNVLRRLRPNVGVH